MKPARRPLSIAEILAEGNREINQAYNLRQNYTSRSRLTETLLFEADMHPDVVPAALEEALSDDVIDMAEKLLSDVDKPLYKSLAAMIQKAGGEKVSANVLMDDLEDFDSDGLMELQKEIVSDIMALINNYIQQIAMLATHAKLAGVGPEEAPTRSAAPGEDAEYFGEEDEY